MAESKSAIEKGEYVIGMAILIAALLLCFTVYYSAQDMKGAIGKIKLDVALPASQGGTGAQGTGSEPAANPAPRLAEPDLSSAYFAGNRNGGVMFVEFSDFQCSFCSRVTPTLKQVKAAYPNAKYHFLHFPLSFHPDAQKAAEAAQCAGKQGKFWEMHDAMFANQSALSVGSLKASAARLGLNTAAFDSCLESGETAEEVSAQQQQAMAFGIGGTPGFLVYSNTAKAGLEAKLVPIAAELASLGVDAMVVEINGKGHGIVFAGALPYANFKKVMDAFN